MFLFIVYIVVLLVLGGMFSSRSKDAEGFFLTGRQLGPWTMGFSLAATGFGGSAVLYAASLSYTRGLTGLWFTGSLVAGLVTLGLCFARTIRASGAHSLADFIGQRFGAGAAWLACALLVVVEIGFFQITLLSFAKVLGPLLGPEHWMVAHPAVAMCVSCAIIAAYTVMGGHRAVAATDLVQVGLIAVAFVAVLGPLALVKTDWSALPEGLLSGPFNAGTGPMQALNWLVMMGLTGIVGGDVFSKLLSVRDEAAARHGALIAGCTQGVFAGTIALLALAARARGLADANPELAVPLLAHELLPGVLANFLLLAFLSVLLSTADSVLITGATVMVMDVLRRRDTASDWTVRGVTLLLAAAGLALALAFAELGGAIRFAYTLLVASLVGPVLVALVAGARWRLAQGWAMAAMLTGPATAVFWQYGLPRMVGGVTMGAATAGVGVAVAVSAAGLRRADGNSAAQGRATGPDGKNERG